MVSFKLKQWFPEYTHRADCIKIPSSCYRKEIVISDFIESQQ